MAVSSVRQELFLQGCLDFKNWMEIENRKNKDLALEFSQKLNAPEPLANDPNLQAECSKAYAAYRKISSDILNTSLAIDELYQNQTAFLDRIIDHVRTPQIIVGLSQRLDNYTAFKSFCSQLEPLQARLEQLDEKLYVEEVTLANFTLKADKILPLVTSAPKLIYPVGLRHRTCHQAKC